MATEQKKDEAAQPSTPTFPVERLVNDAREMLGFTSYEAAGGLYGVKGEITVADAKKRIRDWLKKPMTSEEG